MSTITFHAPAKSSATHGALWAAGWALRAVSWLEHAVHHRAEASRDDSRVAEAARLRRFAQQVMAEDPRFAADLFAAADHHERS